MITGTSALSLSATFCASLNDLGHHQRHLAARALAAVLGRRRRAAAADRDRAARRRLVREDVVEVGAGPAARRQPAHVRPLAVAAAPDPRGQRSRRRRTRPPSPPRVHRSRPGSSSTCLSGPCAQNFTARRGRSPPARSSRPPAQPPRSPGSCPSRAGRTRAVRASAGASRSRSSRSAANHGRASFGIVDQRRHRHQAAEPDAGRAAPTASRNASTSAGRHAGLRVLAGDVHLQQAVDRLSGARRPRAARRPTASRRRGSAARGRRCRAPCGSARGR